jgi:hypothetical protein
VLLCLAPPPIMVGPRYQLETGSTLRRFCTSRRRVFSVLEYKFCLCESQHQTKWRIPSGNLRADPQRPGAHAGAPTFGDGRFKSISPPLVAEWPSERLILGATWVCGLTDIVSNGQVAVDLRK